MPIDSQHPLYAKHIERWQRCRDAYEGEDRVKRAGVKYLPKVDPTQTDDEYDAYRRRALYYGAVPRTVDGFVGAISRKPHTLDLPPALEPFKLETTMDGTGLDEFIKKISAEASLQGRGGVLVDFDDTQQRAFLALYCVESIINWGPDFLVLEERVFDHPAGDALAMEEIEQLRHLRLVEGIYTVTLWRRLTDPTSGKLEWKEFETIRPTRRGKLMTELPWHWFSSMGQSSQIQKPPMLALVDVALSHYRSSADLEHGRHFTALPTLWISGVKGDDTVRVGAGYVIKMENPQAKAGYAEFTGAGLGNLMEGMRDKEVQMAMLGAAVFGAGKKGVEAAETARIRTAGETSLLMGVVSAVEESLLAALRQAATWMDGDPDALVIKINRDFLDQQLNPQTLVGMVQAWQAGAMSLETFTYCLQQAEMLPPETDIAAEVAKLVAAGPPAPPAAPAGGSPAPAEPAHNPGGEDGSQVHGR